MPRRPGSPPRPSRYIPLAEYLSAQDHDTIFLSFNAIETLIGHPLALSAYVTSSWWTSTYQAHVRTWTGCGWKARLLMREQGIEFRRVSDDGRPMQ